MLGNIGIVDWSLQTPLSSAITLKLQIRAVWMQKTHESHSKVPSYSDAEGCSERVRNMLPRRGSVVCNARERANILTHEARRAISAQVRASFLTEYSPKNWENWSICLLWGLHIPLYGAPPFFRVRPHIRWEFQATRPESGNGRRIRERSVDIGCCVTWLRARRSLHSIPVPCLPE